MTQVGEKLKGEMTKQRKLKRENIAGIDEIDRGWTLKRLNTQEENESK